MSKINWHPSKHYRKSFVNGAVIIIEKIEWTHLGASTATLHWLKSCNWSWRNSFNEITWQWTPLIRNLTMFSNTRSRSSHRKYWTSCGSCLLDDNHIVKLLRWINSLFTRTFRVRELYLFNLSYNNCSFAKTPASGMASFPPTNTLLRKWHNLQWVEEREMGWEIRIITPLRYFLSVPAQSVGLCKTKLNFHYSDPKESSQWDFPPGMSVLCFLVLLLVS